MPVTITKPQATLRELLVGLKKRTGLFGEQIMRTQTISDAHRLMNPVMFRNRAINGNFDIWQRGTTLSGTSSGGLRLADQWIMSTGGGSGAATFSRQLVTSSDVEIFGTSKYYYRHNQTTANTSRSRLQQSIEGVGTLANGYVTLSFYVKANKNIPTATGVFDMFLQQNFGSGGSPSTAVTTTPVTFSGDITTSWKKIYATVFLPSIIGKTIGTDNNDLLLFEISMPPNDTYTIDFAQIQLEAGTSPTPFEFRPYQQELALCQRYYQQVGGGTGEIPFIGTAASSTVGYAPYQFPVVMRVAPTVTVSGNWSWANQTFTSSLAWTSNSILFSTPRNVLISGTVASGLTLSNAILGQTGSGAGDLIKFSAEI